MKRVWMSILCLMMILASVSCSSSGSDVSESTMAVPGEEEQAQEFEMQKEDLNGEFVVMETDEESESDIILESAESGE